MPEPRSLAEPAFHPLPLGSIRAEGWLRRQLQIQADGLTGHLDEFWPDVAHSQWFGGKAEGWERAPYWLDGLIPLAWGLGDEQLKAKARRHIEFIVANQRPDGWYSPYPASATSKRYDIWSILLANKVLVQYHEAAQDPRVLGAVTKNLRAIQNTLDAAPLFDWGRFRWFEGLVSVFYAFDRSPEPWLLELGSKLRQQGFDYPQFYNGEDIKEPTPPRGKWTFEKHGVNTGMALKAGAMAWRLTRDAQDRAFPRRMLEILDRYHGQATGIFSADECLAGPSPLHGTELCAVVEALYSLEHLLAINGEPAFGDRWERIAFNALPATLSPDLWSHQYDQQVNQVQCTVNPDCHWSTNGPDSNLFGLEPNYGCCTANMHQGWPKFAAHLWMRTHDGGLAGFSYAPCSCRCEIGGASISLLVESDYPFRGSVHLTVTSSKPVRFPLLLRIPGWAEGASLRLNSAAETGLQPGAFHRVEREWNGSTEIHLRLPMKAKLARRYREAVTLERGPLLYSLDLSEDWKRVHADQRGRELPHADFEVRPSSPWNYGLVVNEKDLGSCISFEEKAVGPKVFSAEDAGVVAQVKGRKLPGWGLEHGWAAEAPGGVQESAEPAEDLKLIPYGCAKIRLTEFPVVRG